MSQETRTRDVEEAIQRRVAELAPTWFPGTRPFPAVRLQPLAVRPRALLYAVRIGDDPCRPQVLAKVRREWPADQDPAAAGARPRLAASLTGAAEQTALEFEGLREIHRIFGTESGDDRFGAIRPLDHMAADGTLLMDYVQAVTLRTHLAGHSRLTAARLRRPGPAEVWRTAGAWLAVFQRELPPGTQPARQATRDAVVERFEAYADYLARRLGPRAVGEAVRTAGQVAAEVLPERLQLAVGHGDYAPRNVFVRSDGRLAVFDPMPRWRVPRYEDLARFLVAVRLSGNQVHTRGAAYSARTLDRLEDLVVQGFSAEAEVAPPELRCFQLLVLVDRWSALVSARATGWRGRLRQVPVELLSTHLRQEAERLARLARSPG